MNTDFILEEWKEFLDLLSIEILDVEIALRLGVKDTQISGLGDFSHLTIESDSGFPPIFDWLLLHEDIGVIVNELFNCWEILVEIKSINFSYQHLSEDSDIVDIISERINDWKRKGKGVQMI